MNRTKNLRSNITIPNNFNKILHRYGVSGILDNISMNEMCYFVAPYGYGKTMSVAGWLQERRTDAVWITLTTDDDSEQAFYSLMSAAMLRFAGIQEAADDIISAPKYKEYRQDFLWDTIISAEKSECEKILVIDNFGFICDRELLRSVKAIVSELLGRWRVIILSRTELPAVFIDAVLGGQVRLITPKELGFNQKEITEFFNMHGCTASQDEVLRIISETEGWPVPLNAIIAISHRGSAVYGEAAREYVIGFFKTEIWSGLDEELKIFLIKTSILDKLTPAVCRAVTDTVAALQILRRLFVSGLFISRLDEKESYRYHRVFRDFLLNMLNESGMNENELYGKLGWWLFDNNEIEMSFPCFFKAGDLYGLNQALKMIRPPEIGGVENFLKLARCITELDVKQLKPYPLIVARIALIHFLVGDINKMQLLYQLFCEWSEPDVLSLTPEEYAEFKWETGWLSMLDPNEPTKENLKHRQWINYEGYSSVPYLEEYQILRTSVLYLPSMLKGMRDYGDDGLFQLEDILKRIEAGEKKLVDKKESQWLSYLLLAEYHYERERFEEAEDITRRIMLLAEENRLTFMYFIGTALLVKIIRAVHNPKEIAAMTERLKTMIMQSGHTFLLPNFHAFELRNKLADGYTGFTEIFENENTDYEDKPYFYLIYRHLTFVRGLLSMGSFNRAMIILGNLELLCQRYNRPTDLAEVNILRSVALYGLGYEDKACNHLIKAVEWAERYGFIRMFSDDAKDIWPVLELARKQTSGKYIQNIVISCKKTLARSNPTFSKKKNPLVTLTKTERRILDAVQSGMSYAEIAQDNGIRMSTVKSHLHSIYSKLEVSNKTEAIITARNMGIIE